jgi:copper homeostasis protein
MIVEIIACSAKDARTAVEGGADRLEVCSAVRETAGISPSYAVFDQIREAVNIPLAVLVRPRPGNFVYDKDELDVTRREIQWFANNGADSIVCGAMKPDRSFDLDAMKSFKEAAGNTPIACHRCFDLSPDLIAAAHELRGLGFTRVLTSGGQKLATTGMDIIKSLVQENVLEILVGSGVSPETAPGIILYTGATQIHASATVYFNADEEDGQSHPISFGGHYKTSLDLVQRLVQAVRQYPA